MLIDNTDKKSNEYPFPHSGAYTQALMHPLYDADSSEGVAYRAEVNQKLIESPAIMPSPWEDQKRQEWLKRDGAL
jgi:hypothetical protein